VLTVLYAGVSLQTLKILKWYWRKPRRDIIQRSADGSSFLPIANIKAKGSSSATTDYTATDLQPLIGINYYRLQSIDFNGSVAYSKIVKVTNSAPYTIKAFPNPVYDILYIQANGKNESATNTTCY
jgi:trimeric autotransporter adhesin